MFKMSVFKTTMFETAIFKTAVFKTRCLKLLYLKLICFSNLEMLLEYVVGNSTVSTHSGIDLFIYNLCTFTLFIICYCLFDELKSIYTRRPSAI